MAPLAKSSAPQRRRAATSRPQATPVDEDLWALLDEAGVSREVTFMMRQAQMALLEHIFPKQKFIDISFSQLTIMRLIHTRPELSQQRIADAMRIKKTNLTPLINELVADGFVARKHSATNRKAYALHLTRKGEQAYQKAKKALSRQMSFVNDILDPEDQERLVRLLRKIITRLPLRSDGDKLST